MRINVEGSALRDPRMKRLARLTGGTVFETMGRLLYVWALAYDRVVVTVPTVDIDDVAELTGFADRMVEAGLAADAGAGLVRISGAEHRIRYLQGQSERAHKRWNGERNANALQTQSAGDARALPSGSGSPSGSPQQRTPATSPGSGSPSGSPQQRTPATSPATSAGSAAPAGKKRAGARALPPYPDTAPEPTDADLAHAGRFRGLPAAEEWRKMLAWHRAHGRGSFDWSASWEVWCGRWTPPRPAPGQRVDERTDADRQRAAEKRAAWERDHERDIQRQRDEITRKAEAALRGRANDDTDHDEDP